MDATEEGDFRDSSSDEEDVQEEAIDYKSIDFITQHLEIVEDCYSDTSGVIPSRKELAASHSLQILWYVHCVLKPFKANFATRTTKRPPLIIIYGGEGVMGMHIVNDLIKYGLGYCVIVVSRGQHNHADWAQSGVRVEKALPSDQKPDIVIMCSNSSSYPFICRQLSKNLLPTTVFLFITFGLERKKVVNTLGIRCVFRTFQEPQLMLEAVLSRRGSSSMHVSSPSLSATCQLTGKREDDEDYPDASRVSQAAELAVGRCHDVRHIIYILEQYYSLCGFSKKASRVEAVRSVLGEDIKVPGDYEGAGAESQRILIARSSPTEGSSSYLRPRSYEQQHLEVGLEGDVNPTEKSSQYDTEDASTALGPAAASQPRRLSAFDKALEKTLALLQTRVAVYFQRVMSNHLHAVDIPSVREFAVSAAPPKRSRLAAGRRARLSNSSLTAWRGQMEEDDVGVIVEGNSVEGTATATYEPAVRRTSKPSCMHTEAYIASLYAYDSQPKDSVLSTLPSAVRALLREEDSDTEAEDARHVVSEEAVPVRGSEDASDEDPGAGVEKSEVSCMK